EEHRNDADQHHDQLDDRNAKTRQPRSFRWIVVEVLAQIQIRKRTDDERESFGDHEADRPPPRRAARTERHVRQLRDVGDYSDRFHLTSSTIAGPFGGAGQAQPSAIGSATIVPMIRPIGAYTAPMNAPPTASASRNGQIVSRGISCLLSGSALLIVVTSTSRRSVRRPVITGMS